MYQHILVPTDGSDGTRQSLTHGLTLAERFDATIHALSVVPEGPLGTLQSDEGHTAAERAVERVEVEATREGVDVVTAVEQGVPHEEIIAYADDHDIDMIVMGTQGRTGLDRVLVGSVTERIVRMADIPVVTVRLNDEIRIEDTDEAARIARKAADAEGYDDITVSDDPHRTSASWIVPLETGAGPLHVHVDAVTSEARVAKGSEQ
ncbi:universal stress protein [Natrinema hispanicum]|uniref:Nucleotide-binding universal stress protein, UspA family n=1 Tax=Natrinema hispanicum TaxID=392421 RepID=A0A1G6MKP9_9EURY|nr:universal stress protein [Natrinema hispanicum]SDC56051.1 Nucleotide-binding universal stress protein, UspA family [Natrinema hispanicum]SET67219.1 Nucleotide-binding universal stress protein, UspA family [Natrinema hispanicum]